MRSVSLAQCVWKRRALPTKNVVVRRSIGRLSDPLAAVISAVELGASAGESRQEVGRRVAMRLRELESLVTSVHAADPRRLFLPTAVSLILCSGVHDIGALHEAAFLLSMIVPSSKRDASGSPGDAHSVICKLTEALEQSSGEHVTASQTLSHVRILAVVCQGSDTAADRLTWELEHRCAFALPPRVMAGVLAAGSPPVLTIALNHHRKRLSESGQANRPHPVSDLCSFWYALLKNESFHAVQSFPAMHAILLRLVAEVRIDVSPGLPRELVALLAKTSRVYGRNAQGLLFAAFHDFITSMHPTFVAAMSPQYLLRLVGSQMDFVDRFRGQANVTFQWKQTLRFTRLMLELHPGHESLRDLWLTTFKAAMTLDQTGIAVRVLETYDVFASEKCPRELDKDALSQVVRLFGQDLALASLKNDEATAVVLIRQLSGFLRTALTSQGVKPFAVLDAAIVIFDHIADAAVASRAEPHVGQAIRDEAAVLLGFLKDSLAERLKGVTVERIAPLRRSLEELQLLRCSPFWWTCGCECQNPAESTVCYSCNRSAASAWTCSKCKAQVASKSLTKCQRCDADHPRLLAAAAARPPCRICPKCSGVIECGEGGECVNCDGDRSAAKSRDVCPACKSFISHSSGVCNRCGHTQMIRVANSSTGVKPRVWFCATCRATTLTSWASCSSCKSPKPLVTLTVEHRAWTCGCGASNPATRYSCGACENTNNKDSGTAFTCAKCHRRSAVKVDDLPLKVNSCEVPVARCKLCSAMHPATSQLLKSEDVLRPCHECGVSFAPRESDSSGAGSPRCPSCDTVQRCSPFDPFDCSSCGAQCMLGFRCSACRALRNELRDHAFVWKCERPTGAAMSSAEEDPTTSVPLLLAASALKAADSARGEQTVSCDTWNFSWRGACRGCGQPRMRGVVPAKTEVRARYIPWTCASCGVSHDATEVLFCSACSDGVLSDPPPCPRCGQQHVAWACPTLDELEAAAMHVVLEAERLSSPR